MSVITLILATYTHKNLLSSHRNLTWKTTVAVHVVFYMILHLQLMEDCWLVLTVILDV